MMGGGPPPMDGGVGAMPGGPRFSGPGMGAPAFGRPGEQDPDAPSPMQQQKRQARAALYPGSFDDRADKFAADVRAWAGADHAIYLVGAENEVRRMLGDAAQSKDITIVRRVTMPAAPAESRGGMGPRDRMGLRGPGGPGGPGLGGPMRMGMDL